MNERISNERLTAIQEREKVATPGPWESNEPYSPMITVDNNRIPEERLSEIQARADAATAAPWGVSSVEYYDEVGSVATGGNIAMVGSSPADSAFIAAARADIPDLLAEVRRLTAELAASEMKRPIELSGNAATSFVLVAENGELKQQLAAVKRERNAVVVQDNTTRIRLLQYESLRKNFKALTESVLGKDYYNLGMDVYTSDAIACEDIALKAGAKWRGPYAENTDAPTGAESEADK